MQDEIDIRDELVGKVATGELTVGQAEEEALRRGLPALLDEPDPAEFDPMQEVYWTPLMAAAWLMFRDVDCVRSCWADYVTKTHFWRDRPLPPREQGGSPAQSFILESNAAPDWMHLLACSAPRLGGLGLGEAREDLLHALQSGKLEARGYLRNGASGLETIDAWDWKDLYFSREDATPLHEGIRVRRDDVLSLWPRPPESVEEHEEDIEGEKEAFDRIFFNGVGPFMSLGEAALWISVTSDAERPIGIFKAAEHLFKALDEDPEFVATAYQKGGARPNVMQSLDQGIWKNASTDGSGILVSFVDEQEQAEFGGHVRFGEEDWYGARVTSADVCRRWPAPKAPPKKRPASVDLKDLTAFLTDYRDNKDSSLERKPTYQAAKEHFAPTNVPWQKFCEIAKELTPNAKPGPKPLRST